jgi:hypothetical protein
MSLRDLGGTVMQKHWKLVTWFLGVMLIAFLTALVTDGFGIALGIIVGCVVGGFIYFIGKAPFDGRPSDESDRSQNPQNRPSHKSAS